MLGRVAEEMLRAPFRTSAGASKKTPKCYWLGNTVMVYRRRPADAPRKVSTVHELEDGFVERSWEPREAELLPPDRTREWERGYRMALERAGCGKLVCVHDEAPKATRGGKAAKCLSIGFRPEDLVFAPPEEWAHTT